MNQIYLDSVRLLLDLAPELFRRGLFGLKGGTAINLFCRKLPRLSVDLDLVYLDHTSSRSLAHEVIRETLTKAQESFLRQGRTRLGFNGIPSLTRHARDPLETTKSGKIASRQNVRIKAKWYKSLTFCDFV